MKSAVVQTLVTGIVCTAITLAAETPPVVMQSAPAGNALPVKPSATLAQADVIAAAVSNNMAVMTHFFGLSAKQQADIRALQAERMESSLKLREESQAIYRELRVSTNRAVIASRRAEIGAKFEAISKTFDEKCKALLTPEQSAKWNGLVMYQGLSNAYRNCALTPEQDAELQELCIRHGGQKQPIAPGATNAWSLVTQEVETRIMTEKQRDDFRVSQISNAIVSRFTQVGLTPEQDTAIRAKIKDRLPQFTAARSDTKASSALRMQLIDEIRATILTDEQRATLAPVKGTSMPFPAVPPAPKADAGPAAVVPPPAKP